MSVQIESVVNVDPTSAPADQLGFCCSKLFTTPWGVTLPTGSAPFYFLRRA